MQLCSPTAGFPNKDSEISPRDPVPHWEGSARATAPLLLPKQEHMGTLPHLGVCAPGLECWQVPNTTRAGGVILLPLEHP